MIPLLWARAASANPGTGDVCVTVDVDYVDLAGDRWIDNSVDRPARGVYYVVTDAGNAVVETGWLDDDGCVRGLTVPGVASRSR